jgi:hypothetical protein
MLHPLNAKKLLLHKNKGSTLEEENECTLLSETSSGKNGLYKHRLIEGRNCWKLRTFIFINIILVFQSPNGYLFLS